MMPPMAPPIPITAWALWALLGAIPMLLPFARSVELPLLIGAVVGLQALLRAPRDWLFGPQATVVWIGCGTYTLAAAISALDAVAAAKTWGTVAASLRLGLYALGMIWLYQRAQQSGVSAGLLHRGIAIVVSVPLAVWVLDALAQALTGWSLGGSADADRLSGIFGSDNLKLGPILPVLAPLLLWPLLNGWRRWLLLAYSGVLVVVLLAGARAGWISFALVSAILAWHLSRGSWKHLLALATISALLAGLAGSVAYRVSESFAVRVDKTLELAGGDVEFALAGRGWIWQTGWSMAKAHPVNGVGVRGFRHAYADYAVPGDPWVQGESTGASHAHHWLLELLAETGLMGLLLWLAAIAWLWRCWWRSRLAAPGQAAWAALAVLMFPINTHLALYSTFLGIVLAWLLCLAALSLPAHKDLADGR